MLTVVGGGAIGSTIARYLATRDDVNVVDSNEGALKNINGVNKLVGRPGDHMGKIRDSKAVVVALPGSVSNNVVKQLLEEGNSVVDVSFSEADPMELDSLAKGSGAKLVPDAGFAPGLSNILAGKLHSTGKFNRIEMYVAGLPRNPRPPLGYTVTWSVEGLIDEYTRPARIIENGKLALKDPLADISAFHMEGVGDFEAFYSDGLRTLLKSMPGVDMFEKTLRYPGHLEKVKFLRDMGYFSDTPVDGVTARKASETILEKLRTGEEDFCILVVRGVGRETVEYSCVDYYDTSSGTSSMGRMTGYTAAIVAEAMAAGKVQGTGVVPPEKIGYSEDAFSFVRSRLSEVGIRI